MDGFGMLDLGCWTAFGMLSWIWDAEFGILSWIWDAGMDLGCWVGFGISCPPREDGTVLTLPHPTGSLGTGDTLGTPWEHPGDI